MQLRILATTAAVFAASSFAQPAPPGTASSKHPFTFEDMMALKRVSEPVPSPDGKWVAFAAEDVDLGANTKTSHLWIVPESGGESRRLNQTPNHEERPRFSPDGKRLLWTSKATDPTQIWMCDFDASAGALSGKPHQVTNISTGADGAIWSPDGKNIVFVSSVYPEAKNDVENKQRDEELKKSKVKAQIFTRLFYRHWNAYTEFKRSHLFIIGAEADATQQARDLTPGDHDVPPFSLTQATSMRSKQRARTTRSLLCRWPAARRKKFPPVPAAIRRRSIRRMENTSRGAHKHVEVLKRINSLSSSAIERRAGFTISRRISIGQ